MLDEMREFQEENDANFPGEEETSSADDPERSAKNLRSLVASSPHRDACVSFDASATMSAWRRRARRQSNLSRLATSVLSAAAPLMESSDDGRRVSACEACASALRALRGVEICVETDRETLETVRRLFPGDAPGRGGGIAIATRETSPARARRVAAPRRRVGPQTRTRGVPRTSSRRARDARDGGEGERRIVHRAEVREGRVAEPRRRTRTRRAPRRENHRRVATRTTVSPRRWNETTRRTRRHRRKPLRDRKFLRGGRRGRRLGVAAIGIGATIHFPDDGEHRRERNVAGRVDGRRASRRGTDDGARVTTGGTRGRERRRRRPREGWPPSTRTPRGFGGRSRRRDGTNPRRPSRRRGNKQTERRTELTGRSESTPNRACAGRVRVRSGRRLCRRCRVFGRFVPRRRRRRRSDARGTRWRC